MNMHVLQRFVDPENFGPRDLRVLRPEEVSDRTCGKLEPDDSQPRGHAHILFMVQMD